MKTNADDPMEQPGELGTEPTHPEAAYDDAGVDLTLIRRSLELTAMERLRIVEGWARAILRAKIISE